MINVVSERFIHTNILARQHVKRKTKQTRMYPLISVCAVLITMCCFFIFLWIRISVVRTGYHISQTLATQSELLKENKTLRVERAALRASSRVETIARNQLGMVTPENRQIIVLRW